MARRQPAPKIALAIEYGTVQSLGTRARQEDASFVGEVDGNSGALVVVADGMGGEAGGATASSAAVAAFRAEFATLQVQDVSQRLRDALDVANRVIADHVVRDPRLAGMGTTLIACYAAHDVLHWVSVGDSLLLLVRDSVLTRLNADHSFGALKRLPRFAVQMADGTPDHALVSCLTGEPIALIDEPRLGLNLLPGDVLIAASDGLETLTEADVLEAARLPDPQNAADHLIRRIGEYARGDQDNVTALVLYARATQVAWPPSLRGIGTHAMALGGGLLLGLLLAVWHWDLWPLQRRGGADGGSSEIVPGLPIPKPEAAQHAPAASADESPGATIPPEETAAASSPKDFDREIKEPAGTIE